MFETLRSPETLREHVAAAIVALATVVTLLSLGSLAPAVAAPVAPAPAEVSVCE